jgi:nitrate reductase gamma subunit
MAIHHLLLPYTLMLAVHILSVELMLAALPFTKLSHAYTLFLARWYNGASSARKGVAA